MTAASPQRLGTVLLVPMPGCVQSYFYIVTDLTYINIKEMIAYMNSGKPFSIVYVTWDKSKGAGGSVKEVQLAYKHYSNSTGKAAQAKEEGSKRNPNHFHNSTMNIKIPGQAGIDVRKVHVQLIRRFNGAIVK